MVSETTKDVVEKALKVSR
jgi:hypothetical protein